MISVLKKNLKISFNDKILQKKKNRTSLIKNKIINKKSLTECSKKTLNFIGKKKFSKKNKKNIDVNKENKIFRFLLNKQTNIEKDNKNMLSFKKILKRTNRFFTDENISYPESIQFSRFSKQFKDYYKLEGENLDVYRKTIEMTSKCVYPNLYVKYINKKYGYGVFTNKKLKPGTILTRYSGEVKLYFKILKLNQKELDLKNDFFTLFESKNEESERIICPEKFCNLGRFLNHSNNKDQNVKSIAIINPSNKIEILLYVYKNINEGKELLYNYNGYRGNFFFLNKSK
jgi:hypothetical protein